MIWATCRWRGQDREKGTTHFSIVDAYGNVGVDDPTVESSMGSYHMVGGFLLTNQLTDFGATHRRCWRARGQPRGPWQAPRSTMAPTLVFKGTGPGDFVMATGSPGGGTIIQYVLKTVVGALDWGLDAQQATSLVNFWLPPTVPHHQRGRCQHPLDTTGLIDGPSRPRGHR